MLRLKIPTFLIGLVFAISAYGNQGVRVSFGGDGIAAEDLPLGQIATRVRISDVVYNRVPRGSSAGAIRIKMNLENSSVTQYLDWYRTRIYFQGGFIFRQKSKLARTHYCSLDFHFLPWVNDLNNYTTNSYWEFDFNDVQVTRRVWGWNKGFEYQSTANASGWGLTESTPMKRTILKCASKEVPERELTFSDLKQIFGDKAEVSVETYE